MVYNNLKIDLNSNLAAFSPNDELKNFDDSDTTLRLECSGYGGSRSNSRGQNSKSAPTDGSTLVLGLGPTPSTCSSGINRNKKQAEEDSLLELSLSCYSSASKNALDPFSNHYSRSFGGDSVFDDGCTSSKKSGGYMPSLLLAPRISTTTNKRLLQRSEISENGAQSDYRCPSESSVVSYSTGGRRRCSHPTGCGNAARGKWEFCVQHGGGKRCVVEGCPRSAESQPWLCIFHGGGKRCLFQECDKGAQGPTNYCKGHGGGKRCVFSGCTTGAEGNTQLCKSHGGGKRCLYVSDGICPKSSHGGTNFCVNHGGGKRCVEPGCKVMARDRTKRCVRHGGGRRCKVVDCPNCAQGSTDFCKGHGGGRRCNWEGGGKCEKYGIGKCGLCIVHRPMVTSFAPDNNSLSGVSVSAVSSSVGWLEKPAKRRQLIPHEVLVPPSMKLRAFSSFALSTDRKEDGGSGTSGTSGLVVPEGRVHGGSLLSLLGGNLRDAVIDGI